jgi:hypothetical protein
MIEALAGVAGFALTYIGWRWGLGNRNWLEGGVIAVLVGVEFAVIAHAVLRVLATVHRA